ncbi:hypothetical protein ACFL42_04620 [Candidatus Omnitrophota bacterium]
MKIIKPLIAVIFIVIFCVIGAEYLGGPQSWDDLLYMDLSLNPHHSHDYIHYLNRHFHIYLQKIFLDLSATPLLGAKIYWSFLISATMVLIFLTSRLLAKQSVYLTGIIAVILFSAQSIIWYNGGDTYAGFTAMMMVSLVTFLYVHIISRKSGRNKYLLVLLGLLFYFAVRSKETSIFAAVLFLGLGGGSERSALYGFFREFKFVALGILLGMAGLIFLDRIMFDDFFISVNPSHIKAYLANNLRYEVQKNPKNWLYYLCRTNVLAVPFLFYIVGLSRRYNERLPREQAVIWFMPLFLLLLLNAYLLLIPIDVRHLIPVIPIFCILASQAFDPWENHISRFLRSKNLFSGRYSRYHLLCALSLIFAASYFICYLCEAGLRVSLEGSGKSLLSVFRLIAFPYATAFLLISPFFIDRFRSKVVIISIFCISLISYSAFAPAKQCLNFIKEKKLAAKAESRFYPFAVFSGSINDPGGIKIFISGNIFKKYRMLGRDAHSCAWMYNIFFDRSLRWEQVCYSDDLGEISKERFDYVLLTRGDWKKLPAYKLPQEEPFSRLYRKKSKDKFVLLILR